MKKRFKNRCDDKILGNRLLHLYSINGLIDNDGNIDFMKVARSLYDSGLREYSPENPNSDTEKVRWRQTKNTADQLRKHLNIDSAKRLRGDWIYVYSVFFDCSADYLFGFQKAPRKAVASASSVTGLSYKSIEMLRKINDSENPFYEINRFNIDMLDTILSDYYNKLIKAKSKQKTYRTIFRYMWDYIHASDYVAETGDSLNENIFVTNKNDTSDEPLSQLIPVKSLVPHYMKNEIMKCLDSL